tara:strand:- start:449 stop:712 length:264 start_codon:yes stop_codon:yes gene_type:complete
MATNNIDILKSQLLISGLQQKDSALYQVINQLIQQLKEFDARLSRTTAAASSISSSKDFVLLSDGTTPIPSPVDDGFGNFIYVEYTP